MVFKIIFAAVLLASLMLSAHASNPIRGVFSKGSRKLKQALGDINAKYEISTANAGWSSQTVIGSSGVKRTTTPFVKGKSGRKLQQTVDIDYGWSTNNLLYTWQYKIDETGAKQTFKPMVKSPRSKSGRKLQQTVDIDYGWSTNNLLYTWQYKIDETGSKQNVKPMVKSARSKSG